METPQNTETIAAPEIPEILETFDTYGLSPEVMTAMKTLGWTSPTPIQKQALPILLGDAQDFIGLASTGTGKTAAFGIPLVEKIDATNKSTQALVLSPTRELALQVSDQLAQLGKVKGLRVVTIYGGANYRPQMDGVKRGAHIIVATPGRLVDFLEQKIVKLQDVQTMVLDEADEMISMGFKEDLETILKATHSADSNGRAACKTWLFSATMSRDIRRVADTYLEKPQQVSVAKPTGTAETIEQIYYTVKNNNKMEVISRLLQTNPSFYGLIFCQTKMEVAELADMLTARGFPADALHGDKNQHEREATLKKFRDRKVKVVVATDVAARGLDIKDLTHVVNHSLPWDTESYVHRIGRTGRNGQKGIAITLVNPEQLRALKRIMMETRSTMNKGVIPSADQVAGLKIKEVFDKLAAVAADSYELQLANDLVQDLINAEDANLKTYTKEEMLGRFIAAFFPNVFIKKDRELDYMGNSIPRELLPTNPKDNRFTRGRAGGPAYESRDEAPRRYDRSSSRPPRRDYAAGGSSDSRPVPRRDSADSDSRPAPARRAFGSDDSRPPRREYAAAGNSDSRPVPRRSSDEDSRPARREYADSDSRPTRRISPDGDSRPVRRSFSEGDSRPPRREAGPSRDSAPSGSVASGIKRSRPGGGSASPAKRRFRD